MTPLALDIAIGSIILLSILLGYFRGIVREFFTLAGFILAAYVSYKGGHLLLPGVDRWLGVSDGGGDVTDKSHLVLGLVSPKVAAYIAAYGGIFLLVFILMIVIRVLISRFIKDAGLTVVDRLLGGTFGFLRGFLLVFIVYAGTLYLVYLGDADKLPEWSKKSVSQPMLQSSLEWSKKHIDLDKMIENRGNGIAIKFDRIDVDKIGTEAGDAAKDAVKDLKDEVKKEQTDVQKAPDVAAPTPPGRDAAPAPAQTMPAQTLAPMEQQQLAPPPAPAPTPAPAPQPSP